MHNLKVALIHNSTPSEGGSFTYESNISQYLQKVQPINITFVNFYKGRGNRVSQSSNSYKENNFQHFLSIVRQSVLGFEFLRLLGLGQSRFEKFLISQQFDYVYFLSPNPSALSIINMPMINTVWDLGHRHFPEMDEFGFEGRFQKREYFYTNVLKRSFHIVVDGEKTKEEIIAFYGVQKARITPLGLFPRSFSHECNSLCGDEEFIFYPSQFWTHKNHKTLIQAFAKVQAEHPQTKLYLSGSDKGSLSDTKRIVRDLGLLDSVFFLGFVSPEDMSRYYAHARILAFPSRLGYTNLPPLESLLSGTPVLVSEVHSYDFDIPDKYFLKVSTTSVSAWASAILQVLSLPRLQVDQAELPSFLPEPIRVVEIFEELRAQG